MPGLLDQNTTTYKGQNLDLDPNLNLSPQDVLKMGAPQTSVANQQPAMNQYIAGVKSTPDTLTKDLGKNSAEFAVPSDAGRQGTAMGGPDNTSDVVNAIAKRNLARNNDYVNTISSGIKMQAPAEQAQGMAQHLNNLAAQANVLNNNYNLQKQYDLDQRQVALFVQQQQDSILAGILGVLGTIGGAIVGGLTGKKT